VKGDNDTVRQGNKNKKNGNIAQEINSMKALSCELKDKSYD
jgi:hypothetical protein